MSQEQQDSISQHTHAAEIAFEKGEYEKADRALVVALGKVRKQNGGKP